MPLIDELSRAQRVVVVIALGLALGAIGSYLMTLGSGTGFGWYAYAPLNTTLRPPGTGLATWLRLIIWLALIGLWALAAIRVLRPRPPADQGRRSLAPRTTAAANSAASAVLTKMSAAAGMIVT